MGQGLRGWVLGVVGAFAVALMMGCDDADECGVQGETQSCSCSDGRTGAQICKPNGIWDVCDCSGSVLVDGGANDASLPPPTGTGGQNPGTGGGGPMGTGGAGPEVDAGEDPLAPPMPPPDGGGTGGTGTGGMTGTGGTMGTGGMMGTGGAPPPMGAAYKKCMVDGDCGTGGACLKGTTGFPFSVEVSVCAPACGAADDCPVPEGSYDAVLMCMGGRCVLDCTATGFPLPLPRSCPGGMTCGTPPLAATSQCYAN